MCGMTGPTLQPVDEPLPAHDHPVYKRSWIVEAAVVHPMGALLRRCVVGSA